MRDALISPYAPITREATEAMRTSVATTRTTMAEPANDIEFSGEPQSLKKRDEGTRVRCNEGLCGRRPSAPTWPSGDP
jgi:hypothetical protein